MALGPGTHLELVCVPEGTALPGTVSGPPNITKGTPLHNTGHRHIHLCLMSLSQFAILKNLNKFI